MLKYHLILFLIAAAQLTAQDTLSSTEVQHQPRLQKADVPGFRGKPNAENLFLTAVYSTVNYPRYAREKRVGATIKVSYLIDTTGRVFIEESRALSEAEIEQLPAEVEPLLITGFSYSPSANPNMNRPRPKPTRNIKKLAKAIETLEFEAAQTLGDLPRFSPGREQGRLVTVRDVRYFIFKLE